MNVLAEESAIVESLGNKSTPEEILAIRPSAELKTGATGLLARSKIAAVFG